MDPMGRAVSLLLMTALLEEADRPGEPEAEAARGPERPRVSRERQKIRRRKVWGRQG